MLVGKKNDKGEYSYVNGEIDANSEIFINVDSEGGDYIVIIKAFWKSFVKVFGFSVYGPATTDIKEGNVEKVNDYLN